VNRGPLLTLGGLAALFVLMFAVNLANSQPSAQPYGIPSATAAPASATATPEPVSPPPSPSPKPQPTAEPTEEPSPKSVYPDEVVYAGRTKDGSIAVAVAVLNGRAAAYICDGRRIEAWMKGAVDGERDLAVSGQQSALKAELRTSGPDRLVGQVQAKGRTWSFEIGVAKKPAGLYRARGAKTTIGWIVLPDGSQVGLQTDGDGTSRAPELDLDRPTVSADGEQVKAGPVSGATEF